MSTATATATTKKRKRRTLSDLIPGAPVQHTADDYYRLHSVMVKRAVLEGIFTPEDLKQIVAIVRERINQRNSFKP